jgi:putative membrane protein
MGAILNFVIALLISALVIWIVSRLNLGLTVRGYGAAIIAALVIAVVGGVILWLLGLLGITIGGGLLGAIVLLIVAAVVLMLSDKFVPGMEVKGFSGAIIAAIAIAVVSWIISWLFGLLGIAV